MNGVGDMQSEIFLPSHRIHSLIFNKTLKLQGFMCVFKCQGGTIFFGCMAVESWVVQKNFFWEQRLFFTYLFPEPALHLILVFHIDPIVALPGESSVLISNIRKRIGQSKMRKRRSSHVMSLWKLWIHPKLSGNRSHNVTFDNFYLWRPGAGNTEGVPHLFNRRTISIEVNTL